MSSTVTPHYYKFADPITKEQTKDMGWVAVTDTRNSIKRYNSETKEWEIIEDEPSQAIYTVKPPLSDALEVSEQEYDALNTDKESKKFKLRRLTHTAQYHDLLERINPT